MPSLPSEWLKPAPSSASSSSTSPSVPSHSVSSSSLLLPGGTLKTRTPLSSTSAPSLPTATTLSRSPSLPSLSVEGTGTTGTGTTTRTRAGTLSYGLKVVRAIFCFSAISARNFIRKFSCFFSPHSMHLQSLLGGHAGKSTLLHRFLHDTYEPSQDPTLGTS